MKAIAAIVIASATATALAGNSVSQTFNYEHSFDTNDPDFSPALATFQSFDTMGGTRELTAVTLQSGMDVNANLIIQNFGTSAYSAGEWSAEVTMNFLAVFLDANSIDGPNFGLGGVGAGGITGDLDAGDGFGNPGEVSTFGVISDHIESFGSADSSFFGYFASGGTLTARVPFLFEFLLTPPNHGDFDIFGYPTTGTQSGSMTLTYQYRNVPAPLTAAPLTAIAVISTRRRRD